MAEGQLPTGTPVLVLTIVCAVAASQELLVRVDVDVLAGYLVGAVLDVLRVVVAERVDAGDGHLFLAVGQVRNMMQLNFRSELIVNINIPRNDCFELNLRRKLCLAFPNIKSYS